MTNKPNKCQPLLIVCALIISAFVVMTWKVYPIAADRHNFLEYAIRFSFRKDCTIWLTVLFFAGIILKYLFRYITGTTIIRKADKDFFAEKKKLFRRSFILNCLVWGCVFLLLFPGAAMNDTINCMMSPVKASGVQPLVFELFVYGGLHLLEKLTGNIILAYAVLTLGQFILCAYASAYAVAWLYGRKIKLSVCYFTTVAFAFSPLMADYSITLVKDSCFAFFFLLLLIQVYDLVAEKSEGMTKGQTAKLAVLMTLVTLFRSNGKVVTAFLLLILLLVKCMDRKKILAVIVVVAGVSKLNGAVVSHYNPESVAFREASGVITQQMAAVIARDGNITEEESEFLGNILPVEQWKSCYAFSFADSLKFNAEFDNQFLNEHKLEYVKTWFSLLKKNFKIYVDAYLFHTYQLWNIASFDRSCVDYTQSIFTKINNNTGDDSLWAEYLESIGLKNRAVYPEIAVRSMTDTFVRACELNLLLSPGWMILIFMICIFFSLMKGCWTELIFLFPPVLMWLFFMAATPLAGPYRYSFYLLVTLPFGIMMAWRGINGADSAMDE